MKRIVRLASILLLGILAACAAPTQPIPQTPATQTPFPLKEIIQPGEKIGEMTVDREGSIHYFRLIDACPFDWTITEPNSQTVECTLPELSVAGVNLGWWAEKTKFESNWKAISWELYIDDYQIALDQFGWEEFSMFDAASKMEVAGRAWNVILRNLSAGKHTIRYSISQEESVDDGWNTYPPGKYEYIANLTVTEKAVYPTIPPVAEPGQHAYTSEKANLEFLLYLPETYGKGPETKWPLIVYLHDAEMRGTNPDFIRKESLPKRLDTQKDFPFIVFSPVGNGGWDFWSKDEMITPLFTVLEEIQSIYSVDPNRIYLTGAGMGGNGVWVMGLRRPEYFAALAPFDGYFGYPFEVPKNICDLKDVPVWAFHGGSDFMVPVEVEQDLVEALNACGGNAQITVKAEAVIPVEEYAKSELYDWFLSQSKSQPSAAPTQALTLATSLEEILGTWTIQNTSFIRFNEDGTFDQALAIDKLDDQPFATSKYWFEGTQMHMTEISVSGVPSCGNKLGIYEVQLLENGNIQIIAIKDQCAPRAGDTATEYEPVH